MWDQGHHQLTSIIRLLSLVNIKEDNPNTSSNMNPDKVFTETVLITEPKDHPWEEDS